MSIDNKLDKIQDDVSEIKVHLGVYNAQLGEHIRRTELLEKKVEPIEKHVAMVSGIIKFIGIMAACAAIAEVALQIQGKQ